MNKEIFISYAWGDNKEKGESRELIVDEIYERLKGLNFNIIRDKKDLNYKGNIKDFEKRIGKGDYIILIVSDKFLTSKHCMFEVIKIMEHKDIYDRIFPVILDDAKIYDQIAVLDYVSFWDHEIQELDKKLKDAKQLTNLSNTLAQLNIYSEIRRLFDDFTGILQEMNALSVTIHRESHFIQLISAIEQKQTAKGNEKKEDTKEARQQVHITMKGKYVAGGNIVINKK